MYTKKPKEMKSKPMICGVVYCLNCTSLYKSDIKNCRPIFLLCVISKVLEKLIHNQIINFLYPLISIHQFGSVKVKCAEPTQFGVQVVPDSTPFELWIEIIHVHYTKIELFLKVSLISKSKRYIIW